MGTGRRGSGERELSHNLKVVVGRVVEVDHPRPAAARLTGGGILMELGIDCKKSRL